MAVNRIAFIIVYFGKWPAWFRGFLFTCQTNPAIDWLIYTDCTIPISAPSNVKFIAGTYEQFRKLASAKTGVEIPDAPLRKLCDLKPAYGHILEDHLSNYTHWGFCDMDIFWGNIQKFVTDNRLQQYDVITSLVHQIAGHFTILKNNELCRKLYQAEDIHKTSFQNTTYQWFDERIFSDLVDRFQVLGKLKVFWDQAALNEGMESPAHQNYYHDRWLYDKGSIFSLDSAGNKIKEFMYLHFISWKKYMKCPDILDDEKFYISYNGIHNNPTGKWTLVGNQLRRLVWGFPQRKAFNLWKRKFSKRWASRLQRWGFVSTVSARTN